MKKVISLLIPLLTLTACMNAVDFVFEPYIDMELKQGVKKEDMRSNYYQFPSSGSYSLPFDVQGMKSINSLYDLKKNKEKKYIYPNPQDELLDLNLLVVPISYKDSQTHSSEPNYLKKREDYTTQIKNAFFGTSEHNTYYSVSEYFNRSSYGYVSLHGEVTPFYELDYTSEELKYISGSYSVSMDSAKKIVVDVSNWLRSDDYPSEKIDFNKYDTNKDGYIDGIYLLYDYPSASKEELSKNPDNLLFWQVNDQVLPSHKGISGRKQEFRPYVCDYSWSSLDEERLGSIGSLSSSSYYIHETSHLFGLDDYYNTLKSGCYYAPTGYFDMMDYNMGDHNAFNKYLMNWTTPKVLTNEGDITINSFIDSGDFILIPSNLDNYQKHNSPYDEYLLLEYFKPISLNTSSNMYQVTTKDGDVPFRYPNKPGLKVYHVDARLAYYNTSGRKLSLVEQTTSRNNLSSVYFAFSNSVNSTDERTPVLCHLLEKSGNNTFFNGYPTTNETLFKTKDTFGVTTFSDFTFNNGEELDYTFEIKNMNGTSITITFKQKTINK